MRQDLVKHMIFAVAAFLSACLMLGGLEDRSPTEDEWAHLVRGVQYWHGDDHRLQYAHPPLANAITAWPVVFDEEAPDFTTMDGWSSATVGRVAYAYLRADYGAARANLMRARRASVGLALLGLLYAYLWGRSVLGRREGLGLALVLAFHPTVLGQARYVSSDLACAVFCFVAVGELVRHLRRVGWGATWVGVPLGLSLAVASKHSALLLVPLFVLVTGCAAVLGLGVQPEASLVRRAARWAGYCLFNAACVVLALNLAYGFQGSGMRVADILSMPEPQYWVSEPFGGTMLEERSVVAALPGWVRIPLPYTWVFGVSAVGVQSAQGYPWASFLGAPNPNGHPAFFPVVVMLKTPLIVILGGLVAMARHARRSACGAPVLVTGVVALGFLVCAMTSRLNMGVRHVLPVLSLSSVWAAVGLCALWSRMRTSPARAAFLVAGAVALLGPALLHQSDYLGYFNVGRRIGHQVSVVGEDVGQDRLGFARWVDEHDVRPLFYDAQTATRALEARWAGLRFYELDCRTVVPAGAYVAIHASRRIAIGPRCFAQLSGADPVATFNDHIDVYRIPLPPADQGSRRELGYSGRTWARIPARPGQGFRPDLGKNSGAPGQHRVTGATPTAKSADAASSHATNPRSPPPEASPIP